MKLNLIKLFLQIPNLIVFQKIFFEFYLISQLQMWSIIFFFSLEFIPISFIIMRHSSKNLEFKHFLMSQIKFFNHSKILLQSQSFHLSLLFYPYRVFFHLSRSRHNMPHYYNNKILFQIAFLLSTHLHTSLNHRDSIKFLFLKVYLLSNHQYTLSYH